MGAWGVGMRENDMAADAVDTYGGRLDGIGKAKLAKLLVGAKRRFGVDGVLGLAEETLERGGDLRPLREFLRPLLMAQEQTGALYSWNDNAKARKHALQRFNARLDRPPLKSKSHAVQS